MKEGVAVQFLKALGCHDASRVGGWVTCKCPLAPFLHKSGKDSTPSFGINIDSGKFNCFACQKGSLETLLGIISLYTMKPGVPEHLRDRFNLPLAREILQGAAGDVDALPSYEEAIAAKQETDGD